MTIALVESPFQFLSALEAKPANERMTFFLRPDLGTMKDFVNKLPAEYLEHVDLVWRFPTPTEVSEHNAPVLVGDLNSGQIQRLLLRAAPHGFRTPEIVIVDDGWSTLRAIRNLSRAKPLIRPRVANSAKRILLGAATGRVIARLLKQRRVAWVTALPVTADQTAAFEAVGGRIRHHSFARLKAAKLAPARPASRVIIGSALASDGLIREDAYINWVAGIAQTGPTHYFPHRRSGEITLQKIHAIPNIDVVHSDLPVEISLASAPAGTQVFSLPSTTLATLPLIMNQPDVHPQVVPESWWNDDVQSYVRAEFNRFTELARDHVTRPVLIAISDSESYLKWSAALCTELADDFDTHVWLIDNPILPTSEQIANAVTGTAFAGQEIPVFSRARVEKSLQFLEPSIVLAAATGPVVKEIFASAAKLPRRPGLVSGLPGVGLPATHKGQRYRRLGDMFIAHSRVEQKEYEAVIAELGLATEVTVHRLPMLTSAQPPLLQSSLAQVPTQLIFAPQAKVPTTSAERQRIIEALAQFSRRFPDSSVIVKVRSRKGEHETHHEAHPYVDIIAEMLATGRLSPNDVSVEVGAMSSFLTPGSALATVSSTAALESLDRGLPTFIINDFGVDDHMLNRVFADSGITGSLAELVEGKFSFPQQEWLAENYFQPRSGELTAALRLLARRSLDHQLPSLITEVRKQSVLAVRTKLRFITPKPIVKLYRLARYGR